MRIGILGTRGIPNYHGGFEQFAENFAVFAQQAGHEVVVYNSSNHPYQKKEYKNVQLIHCYDPEPKIGTAGQFVYDLKCILNSRKQHFDIILELGYTSSAPWFKLHSKTAIVITNMDGLEWKRSKYSSKVQNFLLKAEKWAVNNSDYLISDSVGIQKYLKDKYNKKSTFITYGSYVFDRPNQAVLEEYKLNPYEYNMLIARMEPENNIEIILDGVAKSKIKTTFLVVGKNTVNEFGKRLTEKYKPHKHIHFVGGIYNQNHLDNLRYYSNLYFHGHSVGGTNPSLLEAMASSAFIIANDNLFNKAILEKDALYFNTIEDVQNSIEKHTKKEYLNFIENNLEKIKTKYSWEIINKQYLDFFEKVIRK